MVTALAHSLLRRYIRPITIRSISTTTNTTTTTTTTKMSQKPVITSKDPLSTTDARWIKLYKLAYTDEAGRSRAWELAERSTRKGDCDAVAILSLLKSSTTQPSTIIITQFRPPVNKYVVELPAGLIDANESPEQAAVREMKEETGYTVTKVISTSPLVCSDPGMTSANMKLVTVEINTDLEENAPTNIKPELEDGEFIERHVVPIKDLVKTLLDMDKRGFMVDARLMHLALGMDIHRHF